MSTDFQIRQQDWREAAERAKSGLASIRIGVEELLAGVGELTSIADDYSQRWTAGEESYHGSAAAQLKLQNVTHIQAVDWTKFEQLGRLLHEADDAISLALQAEFPLGYGRDEDK